MFFIDRDFVRFSMLPGQQVAADSHAARRVPAVGMSDQVAAAEDSEGTGRPVETVV